jgi:hypothetical protein
MPMGDWVVEWIGIPEDAVDVGQRKICNDHLRIAGWCGP